MNEDSITKIDVVQIEKKETVAPVDALPTPLKDQSEPVSSSLKVPVQKVEKIALVYSLMDPAGELIFKKIEEIGIPDWAVVYSFEKDIIFTPIEKVKESKVIFLSKHASASGTRSLTVHMIGNFGDAKYGGHSRELCGTLPWIGANYLRVLDKKNISSGLNKQGFTVSYESTHHGPFTNKQCVFIELGSSPAEWKNELGAKVIAETVIESTLTRSPDRIVIGLGGGHYAPDFTKLTLRKGYAFGHMCPKHHLDDFNFSMLKQMIAKSRASEIILDWKGLKEHKERILALCKKSGLPFERVQNLLK
ncbi:MAG: D-aminoacyl-tRNA deacylase [archaeon]